MRRVGVGVTNYVWGNLTPNQYMCFRVRSFNGSGFSAWVSADTPYYRCAVTPRTRAELLAFPISGNSHIGSHGLHDDNFGGVRDDTTNTEYVFNSSGAGNSFSLDLISPGDTSVHSVRAGNVLAVRRQCELVVVDSGDVWFVYVHIIPSSGLQAVPGGGNGLNPGHGESQPPPNKAAAVQPIFGCAARSPCGCTPTTAGRRQRDLRHPGEPIFLRSSCDQSK